MPNVLKADIVTLLSGGSAWAKGAVARDSAGLPCAALSPDAVAWDLYGALLKVISDSSQPDHSMLHRMNEYLRNSIPSTFKSQDIDAFNDAAVWADIDSLLSGDFFLNLRAHANSGEHLSIMELS